MITQLEKYVVTYKDNTGKIVCSIPDYYDMKVVPLNDKFKAFTFNNTVKGIAICPFHDDHDPSLGLMKDRFLQDVMLYHCLGCGVAGTVVRFHQRIEKQYHGRNLTVKESCIELCSIFGIPVPKNDLFEDTDLSKKFDYKMSQIDKIGKRYTEKEFARNLLDIRKGGVDINRVNSECVKMTSVKKGLFTWS